MEVKVFRSRFSVLLIGIVLAAFIFAVIPAFQQMRYNDFFILSGSFIFVIFLFCGMRYIISGNKLYIKVMWIIPSGSVDIANIISVKRSYNPLSSPACSLKRLCIHFKNGLYPYKLISPVREQDFIEALKAVNPDIHISAPNKKGLWRIWNWDI